MIESSFWVLSGVGIAEMRKLGSDSWPITRRIVSTYIEVKTPHGDLASAGRSLDPHMMFRGTHDPFERREHRHLRHNVFCSAIAVRFITSVNSHDPLRPNRNPSLVE